MHINTRAVVSKRSFPNIDKIFCNLWNNASYLGSKIFNCKKITMFLFDVMHVDMIIEENMLGAINFCEN